jgi:uncharacterized protein YndB with AHSA1/START domain
MTEASQDLRFTQKVEAPPEDVFYAFATAQGWRDWLCDSSRFESRPGGSYQLAWSNGWYATGTVHEITKPENVVLTWFGMGEPGPTEVAIELKAKDGGTEVELRHSGFGDGDDWKEPRSEARKGWEAGLENLESIFRNGKDLRTIRQPMLGIFLSDFNEEIAEELGVPVTKGVRVDRPVEGMGAERAGIQPSDVLVEFDGKAIRGFADLDGVLKGKQAGDTVSVSVYRGADKVAVDMELSSRPIEKFDLDPAAIANRLRTVKTEVMKDLRAMFEGVSEDEADFKPGKGEWSAKETLAHLIISETFFLQSWITELMGDGEREYSGDGGEGNIQLKALLQMTPTVPELLDRLEHSKEETLTLLSMADKLKKRKGVLWRLGQALLQYPDFHERSHMDQIQAAIDTVRQG